MQAQITFLYADHSPNSFDFQKCEGNMLVTISNSPEKHGETFVQTEVRKC